MTALMGASLNGHLDVVRALLAAKANVNAKYSDGMTALMMASSKGNLDLVQALLAEGADVNAKTSNGVTALMLAKDAEVRALLVRAGAKPEVGMSRSSSSSLQHTTPRQANLDYVAHRQAEAVAENALLAASVESLQSILSAGLKADAHISFDTLYRQWSPSDLPAELQVVAAPDRANFDPKPLGFIAGLIPGAKSKHAKAIRAAEVRYQEAIAAWERVVTRRNEAIELLKSAAESHNQAIDAFREGLQRGEAEEVKGYAEMVLSYSPYPKGFPQEVRAGFVPESKQLVVDLRAPTIADVVPTIDVYKYVKAKDEIVESKKPEKARQALYSTAIAQLALRTLHELFSTDDGHHFETIVLNVYVVATDPSTGKTVRPYIISTRVSRDEFGEIQLANVDPVACLKRLKSLVSRSPAELVPIKPIVDINMADPRFIEEQDVLSSLDSRPNLMELTPSEFEVADYEPVPGHGSRHQADASFARRWCGLCCL